MRLTLKYLVLIISLSSSLLASRAETVFYSLSPTSIREHLAFAIAYETSAPELSEKALNKGWELLSAEGNAVALKSVIDSPAFSPLLSIATKGSCQLPSFSEEAIALFERLGKDLHNRELKGHAVWEEKDLLSLEPDQIDLARGLLISQGASKREIQSYEAVLDFLALEIRASCSKDASTKELINETNRLIFEELRFRFPPQSQYSEAIDEYTFLGSVLDSRRGVCLGVSTLIFSIGQRLGIEFEAVTPPGHIYLRADGINVETTARGVHLPTTRYLGMNTLYLPIRNGKEMIGFTHFNQASVFWQNQDYKKAIEAYEKALQYAPKDPLILELLAFAKVADGQTAALGESIPYLLGEDPLREDLKLNRIDQEGVQLLFRHADKRKSIENKRKELEVLLSRCPTSLAARYHLGITWLQLGRAKEGVKILKEYSEIDSSNPLVEYYLAALQLQRQNLPAARRHTKQLAELAAKKRHDPEALRELNLALLLN